MNRDLYYVIEKNGYHIYDRNDPLYHIHQYGPYISDKSKSFEENAKAQIHELIIMDYLQAVENSSMTISEVPEEYRAEVESRTDDEATEGDYVNALAELGVQ